MFVCLLNSFVCFLFRHPCRRQRRVFHAAHSGIPNLSPAHRFILPHGPVARGPRDLPQGPQGFHSASRTGGQRSTGSSTGSTRSSFIVPHGPVARGPRDLTQGPQGLPSFCLTDRWPEVHGIFLHSVKGAKRTSRDLRPLPHLPRCLY